MASPLEDKVDTMINLFDQVNTVLTKNATKVGAVAEANKELKKRQDELYRALEASGKGTKDYTDRVKAAEKAFEKQNVQMKLYHKHLKLAKDGISGFEDGLRKVQGSLKKVQSGIGGVTGFIGKLTGALGITGISFGNVVKSGLQFNRTLYEIRRAQQVAGKGSQDLGKALQYATKNTVLSKMQFAELANTIQSSFLGLKPSLTSTAQLVETIGRQLGYSYEAQKKGAQSLMSIQNKFPSVYEDIIAASNKLKEAEKRGEVTEELKKELAVTASLAEQRLQMAGVDRQSRDVALQMLSERTHAQKVLMETEKEAAKATKEMDDAKLSLFQTIQPMIIKATQAVTALVKKFTEYKEVIVGTAIVFTAFQAVVPVILSIVSAIKAAKAAQIGFNLAALKNPYVLAVAGAATLTALIAKLVGSQRRLNAEQEQMRKETSLQMAIEKDRQSLTAEQTKLFKEQWGQIDKSTMSLEEQVRKQSEIIEGVKEQTSTSVKLSREFERIKADVGAQLVIIEKISAAMGNQVKIAQEFGMVNEQALMNMIRAAQMVKSEVAKELQGGIAAVKKSLEEELNIKINLSGDLQSQAQQLQSAGQLLKDGKGRNEILKRTAYIMEGISKFSTAEADIARTNISFMKRRITQQEQFTSAYESRLDTQRQLMESAQFGLGASVEMMQKQVDLAYELQQTYAKSDEDWQKSLVSRGFANEQDLQAIQNAQTQAEAEEYIAKVIGAQGEAQQELNSYAVEHQKISDNIMKQQQKIYNLTKDIREGYLDAIREMSVGAGEFEKIIGSQEMGVTQLMGAVQDVTGIAKLNTMALGGLQDKALTAQGVGTDITGKYTAGGIQFIGGETQERRNSRIWKYGESKAKTEAVMRGEVGGAPRVGTGVAGGREPQYIRPDQEEEKIVYDGTYKALTAWSRSSGSKDIMGAINIGVKRNSFSRGEVAGITSGGGGAGAAAMGAGYLQGSNAPTPASGGYVNTPGRMAIPNTPKGMFIAKARRASVEEEAIYNRKMQELEEEFKTLKDKNKILRMDLKNIQKGSDEHKKLVGEIKNNFINMRVLDMLARDATGEFANIGVTGMGRERGPDILGLRGKKRRKGKKGTTTDSELPEFQDVPTKYLADKEKIALLDMSAAEASVKYYESQKKVKQETKAAVRIRQIQLDHDNAIAETDQKILKTQTQIGITQKWIGKDFSHESLLLKDLKIERDRLNNLKKIRDEQIKVKDSVVKELDLKKQSIATEEEKQAFIKANVPAMKATEQAQEGSAKRAAAKARAEQEYNTKRIMWARKQYARQGVFKKTSDRAPGEQGPLTQSGGFTEAKIGGSLGPGEQGPLTQAGAAAVQRLAFPGRRGQGGSSESRTLAERSKKWREEMSTTMKSAQPEGQFTSAAQKYGFKSSEKYQQDYAANAQEREAMYGIEPEGGAGGAGGRVLVTISLAPGLQGQIDDATNAAVELRVASG